MLAKQSMSTLDVVVTLCSSLSHCSSNCGLYVSLISCIFELAPNFRHYPRFTDSKSAFKQDPGWHNTHQMRSTALDCPRFDHAIKIPATGFIFNTYTEFISNYEYYKWFYRELYLEFWTKGDQKMKICNSIHSQNDFSPCIFVDLCVCVSVSVWLCSCIIFWFPFSFQLNQVHPRNFAENFPCAKYIHIMGKKMSNT